MDEKRYWFRRRRFGLGWIPKTWEGWAATGAFVLAQIALPAILERSGKGDPRTTRRLLFGVTAAYVAVAAATGEPLW
jgi:hypothetical protein